MVRAACVSHRVLGASKHVFVVAVASLSTVVVAVDADLLLSWCYASLPKKFYAYGPNVVVAVPSVLVSSVSRLDLCEPEDGKPDQRRTILLSYRCSQVRHSNVEVNY